MNRSSSGLLPSRALVGFLQYKAAEGLSTSTLRGYEHNLNVWVNYAGDPPLNQVTPQGLREFIAWLRTG